MSTLFSRTLRTYAADAAAAVTSAPAEVLLGIVLAATFSYMNRHPVTAGDDWARLACGIVLAFPLVFAASVLRARGVVGAGARWGVTAAVIVAAGAYAQWGVDPGRTATMWRWFLLAVAAVLVLLLTPVLPWRERERARTWSFDWRLLERLAGVMLYAGALYAMLAGAIASVVTLFDLGRPEHLYGDIAGVVFFAVAPWIFVGGIRRLTAPPEPGVPLLVSRAGRWLYAPVLVIYLAILYAYAVKVIVTGELPKNLLSPLVLAAGLVGLIGAALLEPVHGDDEHRGVSVLARWVPALVLPLVPLAVWALVARVGQYGWTEFRYVRVMLVTLVGVLAVMGTLRLIRRRAPLLSTVPAILAAGLVIASVGPWSATAVSRRDQTERLRAALSSARVDPTRLPAAGGTLLDSAHYARIADGVRYLGQSHGSAAVRAIFPRLPDSTQWYSMPEKLGLRRGCGRREAFMGNVAWDEGLRGLSAGALYPLMLTPARRDTAASVVIALRGDTLVAAGPGWRAERSVRALRELVSAPHTGSCEPRSYMDEPESSRPALREARIDLVDAGGRVRAQVLVSEYEVGTPDAPRGARPQPGANAIRFRELSGYVLVPE